jgi:carbamoyltransferase
MEKENVLSIYGSHDASVTFIDKNGDTRVYEYERFVKKRYAMFSSQFDHRTIGSNDYERIRFINLIYQNLKSKNIKKIFYMELNDKDISLLRNFFPEAEFIKKHHHIAHVYSALINSNFDECFILSADGGGLDNNEIVTTKLYKYADNEVKEILNYKIDLGNAYSGIGYLIKEIRHGSDGDESNVHSLAYAGKIMGLSAYGKVRENWIEFISKYYTHGNLQLLCMQLNIQYRYNSIEGQVAYDLAATSQYVFEYVMFKILQTELRKEIKNVILVGGCALNVLFNQKLKVYLQNFKKDLFIDCHPNDSGLSFGMFAEEFPDIANNFSVYNGIEILDLDKIDSFKKEHYNKKYNYNDIIDLLKNGKIIGVINEYSEIGPRALGNRSIICLPTFPNMKDILNSKVKFREWYRPFAPVCQEKEMDKYFIDAYPSPFMSYAPAVKEEFKKDLISITHVDDTARLQTVNNNSHPFFNSLLEEMRKQNLIPVILNTSFNIKGLPILTSIEDAFYVLNNTELDNLIIGDILFFKNKN